MAVRCDRKRGFWLAVTALALLLTPFSLAQIDAAPEEPVPDLKPLQGYLGAAPGGMDLEYAWNLQGGRGDRVRIIDIEPAWNLSHNDLLDTASNLLVYDRGVDPDPANNVNHGTAVLGLLAAADDGSGITGIASRARIGLVSPFTGATADLAAAIRNVSQLLEAGDVIIVEQQALGPRFDFTTGRGLVPVEIDPQVFEAIRSATSRGIIIVEPAANGFDDLDHPGYRGAFDVSLRDSGAIIVGGGKTPADPDDRAPAEDSNYGSRIDVQGWGRSVTTCGYGHLFRMEGENNWYTDRFGGTSAAAAMVAGAAAVVESILKAHGRPPLPPAQLRQLLISTGTAQTGDTGKHIGPRPDLKAAIEALDLARTEPTPIINSIGYNDANGRLVARGANFIAGSSVIEIDGARVPRMKYPSGAILPDGTTTRIMSKGDISQLLRPGRTVMVAVLNPASGKRSEAVAFIR